ncbi:MAG: polysaccharide biosynthesis protein [bacterium]|nr:polysaccharide biosynthesis protein [bacterium]
MGKQTKSIIGGMSVLGLTGIICKLVGVLYSVPLTWLIGADGLGVFQAVFPTYNLLLTMSSAGLPVAVSRMVSSCLAKDDPRSARTILRVALWMLTALGAVCTLLMLSGNGLLASRVGLAESALGFRVIAPCVTIVCVLSAFRGFMQGQQNMVPTAVSQLIEQVGKIFVSLPLAWLGYRLGIAAGTAQAEAAGITGAEALRLSTELAAAQGAAGALLGITIIEAVAMGYMVLLYFRRRAAFAALPQLAVDAPVPAPQLAGQLFRISVPITISACIVPLAQFVDSAMLLKRMVVSGLAIEEARPLYGLFSGMVIRLINVPTALALAVSMSLVPAISACRALNDHTGAARQSNLGLRLAFVIGFPCSIGMSVLAEPIIRFFYQGTLSAGNISAASSLLTKSALTVVLFTVVQATSAILQGLGRQRIPMYTLVAGVACKIILNYTLVAIPGVNIHGAPIASIVCYSVSMVPNLIMCMKYTGLRFNWQGWLLRPAAATAIMGAVVLAMRTLLPMTRLVTILEVLAGIAVYLAAALALKAVTREDLAPLMRRRNRA